MKILPASATTVPEFAIDRESTIAVFRRFADHAIFAGKIVLALPLFALTAVVFVLHLVLPSEKHW